MKLKFTLKGLIDLNNWNVGLRFDGRRRTLVVSILCLIHELRLSAKSQKQKSPNPTEFASVNISSGTIRIVGLSLGGKSYLTLSYPDGDDGRVEHLLLNHGLPSLEILKENHREAKKEEFEGISSLYFYNAKNLKYIFEDVPRES